MNFISNTVASVSAFGSSVIASIAAMSTVRKVGLGLVVVNVAGSHKAYKRAQVTTDGEGYARKAKIAAKTLGGTAYWLTSLGIEAFRKYRAEASFDPTALNADLEKIRVGTSAKSIARMKRQGLEAIAKHKAPESYAVKFSETIDLLAADAAKQPASSILTPAAAKHSKNKFAPSKAKKTAVAPVAPVTEETKKS